MTIRPPTRTTVPGVSDLREDRHTSFGVNPDRPVLPGSLQHNRRRKRHGWDRKHTSSRKTCAATMGYLAAKANTCLSSGRIWNAWRRTGNGDGLRAQACRRGGQREHLTEELIADMAISLPDWCREAKLCDSKEAHDASSALLCRADLGVHPRQMHAWRGPTGRDRAPAQKRGAPGAANRTALQQQPTVKNLKITE